MPFTFSFAHETALAAFAADLACIVKKHDFIALYGDLGAGKTTLARALIRALADNDMLEVPSPTFTLLQHYQTEFFPLAHADLYRLSQPEELEELGLIQMLEEGVLLVEWPQKVENILPQANFSITIDYEGEGRKVTIETTAEAKQRLARSLNIRTFLEQHGRHKAHRRYFSGDASVRRYEKIYSSFSHAEIEIHNDELLMDAPSLALSPIEGMQHYAQNVHLAQDIRQFVGIDYLLAEQGFRVPEILAVDLEQGLLLSNHFGCEGLLDANRCPIEERYLIAAQLLAKLHSLNWPQVKAYDDFTLQIPAYDASVMQREVALFLDWYLPHQGITADKNMRQYYHDLWARLFDLLNKAQKTLVLRDYHSPNLFWHGEEHNHRRIGLIDFQDALIGPFSYDVSSLAQDARVTVAPELEKAILDTYIQTREEHKADFNKQNFYAFYAITAAQRISKIMGIFVRLKERDGKPHYMHHLPRLITYLERSLSHPCLSDLADFYHDILGRKPE